MSFLLVTAFAADGVEPAQAAMRHPLDSPSLEGRKTLYDALKSERDSQAFYRAILEKLGQVEPFTWVIPAKDLRESDLSALLSNYGLPIPEEEDANSLEVPTSLPEACVAAADRERDIVAQYNTALETVLDRDIRLALQRLILESENVHLEAFEDCSEETIKQRKPPENREMDRDPDRDPGPRFLRKRPKDLMAVLF